MNIFATIGAVIPTAAIPSDYCFSVPNMSRYCCTRGACNCYRC